MSLSPSEARSKSANVLYGAQLDQLDGYLNHRTLRHKFVSESFGEGSASTRYHYNLSHIALATEVGVVIEAWNIEDSRLHAIRETFVEDTQRADTVKQELSAANEQIVQVESASMTIFHIIIPCLRCRCQYKPTVQVGVIGGFR
jgi:hypothetical protein